MIQCKKCGTWSPDGTNYCPTCGMPIVNQPHDYGHSGISELDVQQNKFIAVFAYLGILVLIPWLAGKHSRFARFHANQGLSLFIAEVLFNVSLSVLRFINRLSFIHLGWLIGILSTFSFIAFMVLSIWGVVNVCTGRAAKLPILGEVRLLK